LCTSLTNLHPEILLGVIDFILELTIGYVYLWLMGALDW